MLGQFLRGLQLLHVALFSLSAIGFLAFWVRTRFWLPKYAHVLAAVGLVVGVLCVYNTPNDTPLGREGPVSRFLFALALPAIVYAFFVLTGGQKVVFRKRFGTSRRCPNCKTPVTAGRVDVSTPDSITPVNRQCPHCGQLLNI
jgi:hypothetical protein